MLPLYRDAQLHGSTERGKARVKAERRRVIDDYAKAERDLVKAADKRDGLLWLMDHGIKTDNVIFYTHIGDGQFCFGWREPIGPELKSQLLDVLTEFPFDYMIQTEARR